jgi:putative inorganic carbon (HCO3(-)) transporter
MGIIDGSVFARFVTRVMDFIGRFAGGSVIIRALRRDAAALTAESRVCLLVSAVFAAFRSFRDKYGKRLWGGSFLVSFLRALPGKLGGLSARGLGLGIIAGCAVFLAVSREVSPFLGIIALSGAACFLSGENLYELCAESGFSRFIFRFFDAAGLAKKETAERTSPLYAVVYGVYGGLAFALLPAKFALAAFFGPPLALLAAAYPLFGLLGLLFAAPFIPTMTVAAGLIAVGAAFFLKLLTDPAYSAKSDATGVFVAVYILITLFRGVTSLTPRSSVKIALLTSLFMTACFLFTSLVDTAKKAELAVFAFSSSALLTGLYGLYQKYSGKVDMTWVDKEIFDGLRLRVFSVFANPNVFGEYLLLAIPISVIGLIISRRVIAKLYYAGVCAVLLLNLALTYSRGCYLALVLGVFVFTLMMERRLIAVAAAGVFLLPALLPADITARFASITNLADSSTSYRIFIYQGTIRILERFWLLGLGQGIEAFNKVYPLYGFNAVSAPHSHNLFLQVFVETGVFGFAAFLGVLFCYFKTLLPAFGRAGARGKAVLAALTAMMCAFVLQGMFDYSFYNYKVFMLFFAAAGFAAAFGGEAGRLR